MRSHPRLEVERKITLYNIMAIDRHIPSTLDSERRMFRAEKYWRSTALRRLSWTASVGITSENGTLVLSTASDTVILFPVCRYGVYGGIPVGNHVSCMRPLGLGEACIYHSESSRDTTMYSTVAAIPKAIPTIHL